MGRSPWGGGWKGDDLGGPGRVVAEQLRVAETAVPIATLGVEDPELRPSPRRAVAAPRDDRFGPLADHITAEPDPGLALELEPEPGRFGDRSGQAGGQPRWLEGDEERLGPPGKAGQPTQPLGDPGRCRAGVRPRREIEDEDVDRASGEEHSGDREALVEGLRREDDEPVEPHTAGDCLDRIERPGEIEPGDDRAIGLGLRDDTESERGRAGARRPLQGDARAPRQPARPDDRVERRKAGPDDTLDAGSWLARRSRERAELGCVLRRLGRERGGGQRSDHPRSCGTPPRLEGR